jgi:hypothetical protein
MNFENFLGMWKVFLFVLFNFLSNPFPTLSNPFPTQVPPSDDDLSAEDTVVPGDAAVESAVNGIFETASMEETPEETAAQVS